MTYPTAAAPQPAADPTAVMGRRYAAYIIDSILAMIVVGAVALFTVQYTEIPFSVSCSKVASGGLCFSSGSSTYIVDMSDLMWTYLASGIYTVVVFWLLQGLTGFTPGKVVCGLRTVRADGRACGIGRAIVRNLLLIIDGIGCVVPLVGPITAGVSRGHRRVGDMAAGTYVVASRYRGSPIVVPPKAGSAPIPAPAAVATGAAAPPPAAPAGAPAGGAPAPDAQWDPARGTWVRWDGTAWTAYDAASGQWRPA